MRILDIAIKDLRLLVQDWKTPLFLLIMPIFFTIFMGLAFRTTAEDSRLPVGILASGEEAPIAGELAALLDHSDSVRPVLLEDASRAEAEQMVASEDLAGVIVLPAGAANALFTGADYTPPLLVDPSSEASYVVENDAQTAVVRLMIAVQAAQLSVETYEEQAEFAGDEARTAYFQTAFERALAAWEDPPIAIEESGRAVFGVEGEGILRSEQYSYAQSSPGTLIQFGIAGLIGAASLLVNERKRKALPRLLTTPARRIEIIAGKLLAYFFVILVQIFLLAMFGWLVYGLPYFHQPLALLAVSIAFALVLSSMGLLIGAIARTDEAVVILTMVPMFVLSALGGAWFPLEFFPRRIKTIAHIVTPTAWAMEGFQDIIIRGQGFSAVTLEAGVMLLWAAVLCVLAVWRLKFVE